MDKAAIKTFAINSRRKLMEDVEYRMSLVGITKDGIQDSISDADGIQTFDIGGATHSIYDEDIKKREDLIKEVNNKGFENVVEEVAYTWFNRIIAIRFMEVNDYLPTRTRVLSSDTPGKTEPDMITEAFNIDLDYTDEDKQLIFKLKDESKLDELFRFLFIKQCNKLNDILPGLFEKTEDYMELLLNISFVSVDGVVRNLIDTVSEEDFTDQVEIIGWMYQYYISEKKDQVINIYRGNVKKEDIPAATQLFTTDWVVKYMVDNSLGRYWLERKENSSLKTFLDYYIDEANQPDETIEKLDEIRNEKIYPEEIKFFDPCMGSGHILVYAFDIFVEMYKELGYSIREIPELVLKNNIFGLDIDERAYQLAYFAVLMKARSYDRRIFRKGIIPNVYSIKESKRCSSNVIEFIKDYDSDLGESISYLKDIFKSGKEFGSLIQVENLDYDSIEIKLEELIEKSKSTLSNIFIIDIIKEDIIALVKQAKLLSYKYEAVVTNPPYMNKFEKSMRDFAKSNYKDYSKDLFSMFIFRNFGFCKNNGYSALMTPLVWMFISSYEKLRKYIINNKNISSLIQLEYSAFSEATVPICTFVLSNNNFDYNGTYLKLSEFTGGMEVQDKKVLEAINSEVDYQYVANDMNYLNIPGNPIAYWADKHVFEAFTIGDSLDEYGFAGIGMRTGDNKRFLRFWYEISLLKFSDNCESYFDTIETNIKWIPYNKGGKFRKWYGNNDYVVNWENNGFEIKENTKKVYPQLGDNLGWKISNEKYYFKEGITWTGVTSGKFSGRYYSNGFIFDSGANGLFVNENKNFCYMLGLLNSNLTDFILNILNPTINCGAGTIRNVPILFDDNEQIGIYRLKFFKSQK